MKKVLLFLYDSYADFEISILTIGLAQPDYQLVTVSPEGPNKLVKSGGGLNVAADLSVKDVNISEYEALIIPGGSPYPMFGNQELIQMIREFYDQNKLIAAICGGPGLLGAAGILHHVTYSASLEPTDKEYKEVMNWTNKSKQFLTKDKNVLTATGSNYLDFAEAVLRELGVIQKNEENPLEYFRVPSAN